MNACPTPDAAVYYDEHMQRTYLEDALRKEES